MGENLPYNPTRILPSSSVSGSDFVYVFQPPLSPSFGFQLVALNTSGKIGSTDFPYTAVESPDQLSDNQDDWAYIPVVDQVGTITVFAGKCQDGVKGAKVWTFAPTNSSGIADGTWREMRLESEISADDGGGTGANFLASGISFSSVANRSSQIYIFGGMCPNSTRPSMDNWTQGAGYSNTMLTMGPSQISPPDTLTIATSSSRGPPIAEAGFTMTPLEPTYSQSMDRNDPQQQNQNFILLGGHTQQAFINMSQAALFSLPEQSWSFLPINPPSGLPKTDLAARDPPAIEPRSGHTTLLMPGSRKLIVYGGWVGDVRTAADPQMAILELGEGYGGIGDWQWIIPTQTGTGPADDAGLFGHGSTMLPGGVMMILGGYTIPKTSNNKVKRASPSPNGKSYFFNITSNTWIPSYVNPEPTIAHKASKASSAHPNSTLEKVGLAAGLTFGTLAIVLLAFFYLWYSRRLKQRREAREHDLRNLASDAHRMSSMGVEYARPTNEMIGTHWIRQGGRDAIDAYPWESGPSGAAVRRDGDAEAERTGLLFEIPSPTRGLRRSLHSRGAYQPAPRYDDGRLGLGSSNIHPIDERDEYEEECERDNRMSKPRTTQQNYDNILQTVPVLDPFRDLPESSRTPSPESPIRARELEVQNWVSDWAAADALMHHQPGRISPDKTDRTSSSLSEQSTRSTLSAQSYQPSAGTVSRSVSQRSAALFNTKPLASSNHANIRTTTITTPLPENYSAQHSPPGQSSDHRRSQSLTLFSNPRHMNTSDTFATAQTSFTQLQKESETLLGEHSGAGDGSPTKIQSRARGWMGSVRRALTGADRNPSPENGDFSASSSPTKHHHADGGIPRRAASASAMLWQKRKGAKDWDAEGRICGKPGDVASPDVEDEEWDVESAIERRVVQVMFTVPREKLRVINRGPDGDGVSVLSHELKDDEKGDPASEEAGGKEKGKGKET